jgi:hypothetical protein
LHLQDGDIEGSTAKIIDSDDRIICTIETVCKGSSGRLVDYSKDFKTSNLARVLSCLPLRIIEVCRNSDDGMATD